MTTTQIHRIFIKASPEKVWAAITTPEMSRLYGYLSPVEYDLRPGGRYLSRASEEMQQLGMPEVVVTGEVLEADPPRRLVQTWDPVWIKDEEPGTLTWDIEETADGATRLTLTHAGLGAETAAQVGGNDDPMAPGGGGWPWILSGLKTLLETGEPMETDTGSGFTA
ncbi:SRPBCC domain-containing protein [Janibacter endophyticus]|uniref:SRPBCC domain-containing protein n=1 Tax=Janibacter endophyticus TaxID=2806261 RepID=UPI001F31D3BE|nr:SRPBCC domain-containing protein [Janibacter endophyticus]